jgi:hypothetical protein
MAVVIELSPSPEQRETLARDLIETVMFLPEAIPRLTAYEKQIFDEIVDGRAATVGRYLVVKEAAERLLGKD